MGRAKQSTSAASRPHTKSVKPNRERLLNTTLKYFRRDENIIDSSGDLSARMKNSNKSILNKYMIDKLASTHSELRDTSRSKSTISRNNKSINRSYKTICASKTRNFINEQSSYENPHKSNFTELIQKRFKGMFKRSKARKSTKKTIEESSSNNSLIKSPRKFSNMINKMYNISQENEDEDPQFEINFPIAELDIDLPSGTIEAELTGTEFWFKKGKEATNKWAIEAAIDYYIQGL